MGLSGMSTNLAITVDHLSKSYRLRGRRQRYNTIRDSIMETIASPFRRSRGLRPTDENRKADKNFLALDDISFTIPRGEAVGVMGHNGAGKSTLLKILSRITEPTRGSATLFGRVGSLLEVGTGFHLELSGRENVYLSGAIIGMKKAEIDRNFDEIVDFAEVEEFIDTPVKHYSSGMHLRLAFAVAAYLQPEILLIDEVLAVGDARFQRKCLGKMDDVAASGRTVLFVSHNLSAIKELCSTGLVLAHGKLLLQGPVVDAISRYTESIQESDFATTTAGWQHLNLGTSKVENEWVVRAADETCYNAALILPEEFSTGCVILLIHDSTGALVVHHRCIIEQETEQGIATGILNVTVNVPVLWLSPGLYTVHLKFLGRSARGVDFKYTSERRILDVRGWSQDRANALLAPACTWAIGAYDVTLAGSGFRYGN
jgi:lipopolysaccharide transport system ATP-binding protein